MSLHMPCRALLLRGASACLAALAVFATGVLIPAPAIAASPAAPMIFGAAAYSKEQVLENERLLGHRLEGVRTYKKWDAKLFGASETWMRNTGHSIFMSVDASRLGGTTIAFRNIAAAQPGSVLHNDMVAQARQIKAFGARVYFIFHHEPETKWSTDSGTGSEFAAAWRNLVSTYRAQGVTNAKYVFTTSAYAYKRTDSKAARNYYPGDAWVDNIAGDAYNFYGCLGIGKSDKWVQLRETIESLRLFGRQHPDKGLMLMEFGSVEDPNVSGRKAAWIDNVRAMFKEPAYSQFRAALYWTGRNQQRTHCPFDYTTSGSATWALSRMAADPAYVVL